MPTKASVSSLFGHCECGSDLFLSFFFDKLWHFSSIWTLWKKKWRFCQLFQIVSFLVILLQNSDVFLLFSLSTKKKNTMNKKPYMSTHRGSLWTQLFLIKQCVQRLIIMKVETIPSHPCIVFQPTNVWDMISLMHPHSSNMCTCNVILTSMWAIQISCSRNAYSMWWQVRCKCNIATRRVWVVTLSSSISTQNCLCIISWR